MPHNVAPVLHAQLPDDLEFTKEQDDIENPKEFNYDYLLVITKFSVANEDVQKSIDRKHRLYFRWEDDVFERDSTISFHY